MNKHFIMGRVTKDIELKTSVNGVSSVRFNLAVQSSRKNAQGEYITDFFPCVAWRETAERIAKFAKKGDRIVLVGSMEPREYEYNGETRSIWEHNVREFYFADTRSEEPKPKSKKVEDELSPIDDDSLPF